MKAVIVLDPDQPTGLLINTASILAITLGDLIEGIRGPDTLDASGVRHPGVIRFPLPILQADGGRIEELRRRAAQDGELFVADFTRTAQRCKSYEEYLERCAATPTEEMGTLGIAIYGPRRRVDRLVGSLATLR